MRFYAERPGRVFRQLLADVLAVAWIVGLVVVALAARSVILTLQGPAMALADAGDTISGAFGGAARTAGDIPFVGRDLAGALGNGTGAGTALGDAGRAQLDTIAAIATGSAIAIVVFGALPVLAIWLPLRISYALAARAAISVRGADDDLLALRAMARLPIRRLVRVTPEPAAAWRLADGDAIRAMAALELARLGLKRSHLDRADP